MASSRRVTYIALWPWVPRARGALLEAPPRLRPTIRRRSSVGIPLVDSGKSILIYRRLSNT